MSIIVIKGVEMPKDYAVVLKIFPDGKVGTVPYIQWFQVDRIEGAQAIPIPEPHGRLIDADAALKNIKPIKPEDQRKGCTIETTKRLMMSLINRTPTVIPAEEGGA